MGSTVGRRIGRHDLVFDRKTSVRMAGVRRHGTSAELRVRELLKELGHYYRCENRDLPGSPDLANRARGWAVFVHGCFWHRHAGCTRTTTPKRNRPFWVEKFEQNRRRDARAITALRRLGFTTVVVWECEVEKKTSIVERRLSTRLGRRAPQRTRKREA